MRKCIADNDSASFSQTSVTSLSSSSDFYNGQLSILIVGVDGRTGLACLHALAKRSRRSAKVHGFCSNAADLSATDRAWCESVQTGDDGSVDDLRRALERSDANVVVLADLARNRRGLRGGSQSNAITTATKCLYQVIGSPDFSHVRLVIVSKYTTNIHTKQRTWLGCLQRVTIPCCNSIVSPSSPELLRINSEDTLDDVESRTMIVRPTGLTENHATGRLQTFVVNENNERVTKLQQQGDKVATTNTKNLRYSKVDRADLAEWIADVIYLHPDSINGLVVNLTTA